MDADRAYSWLNVKSFDDAAGTFSGVASTPELDRQGHSLDPLGASFKNPLPLLWFHDQERPIGHVTLGPVTPEGIGFTARFANVTEPGALRDRVAEARAAVYAKPPLITAVSIGYRVVGDLAQSIQRLKDGALRLLKTEIFEVSLVTIPANASASILLVKQLAASGPNPPRVEGSIPIVSAHKGAHAMTTAEQVNVYTNTRTTKAARMIEIMAKSGDANATLDDAATKEYDGLKSEVAALDAHLLRLGELETIQAKAAAPIVNPIAPAPTPIISVKANVPPGTAFVRHACALLLCKGNRWEAAEYAKRWDDSTPEVSLSLKAAVAPGTVTDATWAGPLVAQVISNQLIELLRPATIVGRIPGLRVVPFNTKVPAQTSGGSYGWVGEAKPKPVTKLGFAPVVLGVSKVAGLIILTEELVRLSNPSAEDICRRDMVAGIAQFIDSQFIDPAVAAVAGVNPASITNGTVAIPATANAHQDIFNLLGWFAANNIPLGGLVLIMSETNALSLSTLRDIQGNRLFPNLGVAGGTIEGITVITSQTAGPNVIALAPSYVLYADEGGVSIDISREASVQMDNAPMSPADATVVMVSLWQNNLVGLRAERFINWQRAKLEAVKYVSGATYAPSLASTAAPESHKRA